QIVAGGYDPSLAPEAFMNAFDRSVDFIVRGEGEITFRQRLRSIENHGEFDGIAGLSYRRDGRVFHNPERQVSSLEGGDIRLPNRKARVLCGYTLLGKQVDVVETSRGCTFDCSFCLIIENDLAFLRATSKNTKREDGRKSNATIKAIDYLHKNKMYVVGGLIVGNPDDTRESIEANLEFARHYIDWPYIQHPTPYPRTPMTKDFRERGLIINETLQEYDGTTAVVRTEHMSAEE